MATLEAIGIIQTNAMKSIIESCAILSEELGIEAVKLPNRGQMDAKLHHARTIEAFATMLKEITQALKTDVPVLPEITPETVIGQDDVFDYDSMTVPELREQAEILQIDVPSRAKRDEIIAKIKGDA